MASAPEFRIVKVHWRGKDDPGRVVASHFPLTLRPAGPGQWTGASVIYPKVEEQYGQLAVLAPADGPAPALRVEGAWETLHPVRDEAGRTWWIEKGAWSTQYGLHLAPLVNRAGTARFRVEEGEVAIDIAPTEVTRGEFQEMLEEFRNGLWGLVLDRGSGAAASRRRPVGGVTEAFRLAVHTLSVSAERVLRVPHVELREEETWSRLGRVKPSTRTFQALAQRGAPRLVPGRGHAPSFDTAENRAARAMVERVARTVEASARAVRGRADDLRRRARVARGRLERLSEHPDSVFVSAERLRRDLRDVKARADAWDETMSGLTSDTAPQDGNAVSARRTLVVDTPSADGKFSPYKFRYIQGSDGTQERLSQVSTFVQETRDGGNVGMRLLFDAPLETVQKGFPAGSRFVFKGTLSQIGECDTRKSTDWYTYRVLSMDPLPNPYRRELRALRRGMEEAGRSEKGGFWRALKPNEREDRARERAAYRAEQQRCEDGSAEWTSLSDELAALARGLRHVLRRFEKLGVNDERGAERRAPSSMVFVQNAGYRGVFASYRRALEAAGLDAGDVDRLLDLDDVGLLDLPTVYERWGLVQLVRALTEDLGFEMEDAGTVVDALSAVRGRKTVRVVLRRAGTGREVELAYQPWLQTAKGDRQPDYVLTLRRPGDEEVKGEEDVLIGGYGRSAEGAAERKLVLDAKFKPFAPLYGAGGGGRFDLPAQLDELLTDKDYGEGWSNRLFVLHPGPGGVDPEDVGRYSALGGEPVSGDIEARFAWDQERDLLVGRLNHDVGAVRLRPGARDALRRLLVLHLFEGLDERPVRRFRDDDDELHLTPPTLPPFCPSCGGPEVEARTESETYGGRRYPARVVYTCASAPCGHEWVRVRCVGCKRELWKLGPQLNYHSTRPMDPYDVKCPNCTHYAPVDSVDAVPDPEHEPNEPQPNG